MSRGWHNVSHLFSASYVKLFTCEGLDMGFFKEISRNFSFSKGGDVNEVVIAGSEEFERAPSPVALLGAQSRVAHNGTPTRH